VPQAGDLVLQLKFSAFKFGDLEVVRGRVRDQVVELGFERPVPLF
jgi:hypothetical protein